MQRLQTYTRSPFSLAVTCPVEGEAMSISNCYGCPNFRGTYKKNYGYRDSIQSAPDKITCAIPEVINERKEEPTDIQG